MWTDMSDNTSGETLASCVTVQGPAYRRMQLQLDAKSFPHLLRLYGLLPNIKLHFCRQVWRLDVIRTTIWLGYRSLIVADCQQQCKICRR
jgi:hypothetical protein